MSARAFSLLAAGLLALGAIGCKKAAGQPQTIQEAVTQLRDSLANASPEVKKNLYEGVSNGIRYQNYPVAMEALGRLSQDPSLNDAQKKLVNDLLAMVKEKAQGQTNSAASPTQ
jgi:hypothetical protein